MKEAKLKKESGKIFTKERRNSRIKKNCIPSEVSCEIYKRRSGLYMKKQKNIVVEKLIISKDDFKKYFNKRKIISREEYYEYIKYKNGIKNSRLIPDLVFNNYEYL